MELKRAIKKLPSEQNLRLLSSLIVSIANKQSSLEDRVIAPWAADVTYQKDISYVSHNGYVYICSVTNQDSVFTESHWVKLSDEITELDVDTIKSYLNLTQEQITNLQTLIDDTTITTTKTNSSSKIYMDIQAAIAECKDDTLKQIAKKVSGSYKIAASTSDVTSADFIYLISNGSNYDIYVLVDSTPTKVGDTSIDLSNYAKLTDLDGYYDKSTSDGKFATVTTVDNHINDTVAHMTQDEKDKLDTIPTDDKIKSLADGQIDSKKQILGFNDLKGITADSTLDDVVKAVPNGKVAILQSANFTNYLGLPHQMYTITINSLGYNRNQIIATAKYSNSPSVSFIGGCDNSSGTDIYDQWLKIPTTNDITTTINSSSTDTQIPTAKAIFDALKNDKTIGIDCTYENSDSLNINLTKAGLYKIYSPTEGVPEGNPKDYTLLNIPRRDDSTKMKFGYQMLFTPRCAYYWVRTVWNYDPSTYTYTEGDYSIFRKWQRVCTTSVADVPITYINTFEDETYVKPTGTNSCSYHVINGHCIVTLQTFCLSTSQNFVQIVSGLPKPKTFLYANAIDRQMNINSGARGVFQITTGGVINVVCNYGDTSVTGGRNLYATFSYPVAES